MKKKLYLNTITSLLMQITTVACGFVLPRLMLSSFGADVNGLVQSISQFLGIVSFMELGVGQVIQSALYKPLASGNRTEISQILKSGTVYFRRIAYGLLAYIVVLAFLFPHITESRFDWVYTTTLICAISVGVFARYYFGIIDKVLLSADQKGYIQYAVQIATTLLNTVAVALMVYAGCSIQFVKISTSAIFLMNPLIIRWYINRNYEIDRKVEYQSNLIEQKWNGVAQHISAVVLEGTDNIVLTLFATLSDVSVYNIYFMVVSGIRQLYVALTAGLQSMVGALWAKKEMEKLARIFGAIEVALHLFVVFLFSCIAVLIVPFVRVYTEGLADAEYIQPVFAGVLTLAFGIRSLRTPYNIMILAAGHYKQTQGCHIVAAILNIVISIFAVVRWGLVGIAVGTLVAFAYQTAWMVVYNSKSLLKRSLGKMVKLFTVDVLTVAGILLATSKIEMHATSYWGWFCMAVPVAFIALCFTVGVAILLLRHEIKDFIKNRKQSR